MVQEYFMKIYALITILGAVVLLCYISVFVNLSLFMMDMDQVR